MAGIGDNADRHWGCATGSFLVRQIAMNYSKQTTGCLTHPLMGWFYLHLVSLLVMSLARSYRMR